MEVVDLETSRVFLLPAILGLEEEGGRVRSALAEARPDALAVSLPADALAFLRAHPEATGEPNTLEEEVYAAWLGRFGVVRKPPPCYVETIRAGEELRLACHALDMDEEAFTDAFTRLVGGLDLIRRSFRERRLRRHRFRARTPEEFVEEFDRYITRVRGYRELEALRERHMADRLRDLAARHRRILAVVERERARGVLAGLRGTTIGSGRR